MGNNGSNNGKPRWPRMRANGIYDNPKAAHTPGVNGVKKLGRGLVVQGHTWMEVARSAHVLSRFPNFKAEYVADKGPEGSGLGLWVASVTAVYGEGISWHHARVEHIDIRCAVVELAQAMRKGPYVAFREEAEDKYARWIVPPVVDGESNVGECVGSWEVVLKSEVDHSSAEWGKIRPHFMQPGYKWPGAEGVRREADAGSEAG